jgi:hypothetical protein
MVRRTPFLLYLAVAIAVVCSIGSFGWVRTWSSLTVPSMYPPFGDMRIIQAAIISLERGYDPRVNDIGDHWGRAYNIPSPWIEIGKALHFENEGRFVAIAAMATLFFVGICAYLLFRFPSFGLLASVVSTSTLVGVERGNVDLILFSLLLPAALWLPKSWSPIPILAGALLKLYPVFAIAALYIQRQYRMLTVSVVWAIGIFVYLGNELSSIQATTPVGLLFRIRHFAHSKMLRLFWPADLGPCNYDHGHRGDGARFGVFFHQIGRRATATRSCVQPYAGWVFNLCWHFCAYREF